MPYCLNEWGKLDKDIQNSVSISMFKSSLLRFIRPTCRPIYNIHDPVGLKLLTRLRLGLSHLKEHKFRHNFQDTINPLCACDLEVEDTNHFLLRCHFFSLYRRELYDKLDIIHADITNLGPNELTRVLLFGYEKFDLKVNSLILQETISYINNTKRFDDKLIHI